MIAVYSRTAKNVAFHKLAVTQILVCENVGVRQCSDVDAYDLKQTGYNVIINLRGNTTILSNSYISMINHHTLCVSLLLSWVCSSSLARLRFIHKEIPPTAIAVSNITPAICISKW